MAGVCWEICTPIGWRVCADAAHCPWALPADVRLAPLRLILELKPEAPFATKAALRSSEPLDMLMPKY